MYLTNLLYFFAASLLCVARPKKKKKPIFLLLFLFSLSFLMSLLPVLNFLSRLFLPRPFSSVIATYCSSSQKTVSGRRLACPPTKSCLGNDSHYIQAVHNRVRFPFLDLLTPKVKHYPVVEMTRNSKEISEFLKRAQNVVMFTHLVQHFSSIVKVDF